MQTAITLTLWLGFPPRHNTTSKGAKALPIPDQTMITKAKTLWLLIKAQRSAPTVTAIVVAFIKTVLSILCGNKSWVIAAEQPRINESAVDMVAAKIPANIKPTNAGGNRCSAIVGS